jgi:hypothetical protein
MYAFRGLLAGHYDVRVESRGYLPSETRSVTVELPVYKSLYVEPLQDQVVVDVVLKVADRSPAFHGPEGPAWNVWAERSPTLSFQPEDLQRGQDYRLVVNLAAMQYRRFEGEGVYSQESSESFRDWLQHHADIDSAEVEILVVPDQRYLQLPAEHAKRLHVDVRKIRDVQDRGYILPGSPLAFLRRNNGDARWSFGIESFPLRVLPTAPLGSAPLALSFWANGKPIDEVALNLCVVAGPEDKCPSGSASGGYTLRGIDLSGNQKFPDAALHLIERGTDLVGVFRCNSCAGGGYLSWAITQETGGWLADRVSEVMQLLTPPVQSQGSFTQAGDVLYNLVFPNSQDRDEAEAERAFSGFFVTARAKRSTDVPSSLFVRFLSNRPSLVLVPMGLMRVPLPGGSKDFLGFSVNIEAPLELQDYSVQSKCISDWVLLVPPASEKSGELADARDYANAAGWIDLMTKSCPDCTYSDPAKFSDWLLGNTQPLPPTDSQALVVLSQYRNNRLFFDGTVDNPPSVPSGSIRRKFPTPSFAVLDACGTAAPGGSEFIRALNAHGVSSLVATSAAIPGPLGGHFLRIFMELLKNHPDYTVSRARFEAVRALSEVHWTNAHNEDQPFGAQALEFSLVGNGSLRLCLPKD